MNILDMVLLALIGINIFFGFKKGLISSLFGAVGWLITLVAAVKLTPTVAPMFAGLLQAYALQMLAAFVLLVVVLLSLLWLVEKMLREVVRESSLGVLERGGGALLGALKGLFIALLLLNAVRPVLGTMPIWHNAVLANALSEFAPGALNLTKFVLGTTFEAIKDTDLNNPANKAKDSANQAPTTSL